LEIGWWKVEIGFLTCFPKFATTVFSLFLKRDGEALTQKTVNLPPRWQVNSTPAETEICSRKAKQEFKNLKTI